MCYIQLSISALTSSAHVSNRLISISGTDFVPCDMGTEAIYTILMEVSLQKVKSRAEH
jgi:hypothetical protein